MMINLIIKNVLSDRPELGIGCYFMANNSVHHYSRYISRHKLEACYQSANDNIKYYYCKEGNPLRFRYIYYFNGLSFVWVENNTNQFIDSRITPCPSLSAVTKIDSMIF